MATPSDTAVGLVDVGKKTALPLRAVSVEGEVRGCVMGLRSTLKYVNDSPDPVEVLFRFPLEQSHAVVGLTALIDGREIRAQLREKEQARAAYDDAIASGRSAALGEERSGDVFSIGLGNLPPQKEAEIRLQLVGELAIDADGSVRFSLPTSLKARYTPAESSDPLAPVAGGDESNVERVGVPGVQDFCLRVQEASEVAGVTSPTHTITVAAEGEELVARLSDPQPLIKDLVILVQPREPHRPKAIVEPSFQTQEENSFMASSVAMLNFFPDFESKEAECEFIFLVDRSGSMSGSFIRSASEALILFLKSLPESSYFNIIGFGSNYKSLFEHSVNYSQEHLDTATRHAERMDADLGGTELLPPLRHVFSQKAPQPGLLRQVFVLTDGSVSNTEQCIQEVRKNVDSARCFTFGIGSGASSALVEGLAQAGNGTAEFVKEGERLQPKVIRSLKRALQPAVTGVRVTFKVPSGYEALQCPVKLPPIFNGEKLVAYGIVRAKSAAKPQGEACEAVLQGVAQGKSFEHKIPFVLESSAVSPRLATIHHLAGKALISDWLLEGKGKEEIVRISVDSGVVCKYTAFVAVDEESSEPVTGAMKTWDIQTQEYASSIRQVRAAMAMNISKVVERDDRLDCLEEQAECLSNDAAMFQRSATRLKSKGGLLSSIGSAFSSLFSSSSRGDGDRSLQRQARAPEGQYDEQRSSSPPLSSLRLSSDGDLDSDSNEEKEEEEEEGEMEAVRPRGVGAAPVARPAGASSLITLQQADGSWRFDSPLAGLLSKPQGVLESGCPAACQGVMAAVWATVLVLTVLRSRYSDQQDEWELVAMKAERWLKRQALPTGVTLLDLYKAAENVLA